MFQRDYIMRMIEQFTLVLAQAMGLKTAGKIAETHQVLNGALEQFTGFSESTIEKLSYKDLIQLIGGLDEVNVNKCMILAELLKIKADIYLSSQDKEKAFHFHIKSFNIYAETLLSCPPSPLTPNHETMHEIIQAIKPYSLPFETQQLLFLYYESIAEYGKAEDILFELWDQDSYHDWVQQEGIAFYERLIQKSPDELHRGNLPLNEVLEGMAKIKKK